MILMASAISQAQDVSRLPNIILSQPTGVNMALVFALGSKIFRVIGGDGMSMLGNQRIVLPSKDAPISLSVFCNRQQFNMRLICFFRISC